MNELKVPINKGTNVPQYSIAIDNSNNFFSLLARLEKFGFVFTENRWTTENKAKIMERWPSWDEWRYISTGVSSEKCWMILHASALIDPVDTYEITADDFIEKVAPTWGKV